MGMHGSRCCDGRIGRPTSTETFASTKIHCLMAPRRSNLWIGLSGTYGDGAEGDCAGGIDAVD